MSEPVFVTPWEVSDPAECHFYHTMDLPGHGVVEGHVDLRPNAAAYLGNLPLAGRRVLEIGPASGALSFHMESQGASVVALEVDDSRVWEAVPQPDLDMTAVLIDRKDHMDKIKRGFWLAHRALKSTVQVVYGDIYHIPPGLGRFDIVVLGGVLLHCRDVLGALAGCCAAASEAVVVTEQFLAPLTQQPDLPLLWLAPSRSNGIWDVWWRFTPGWVAQALPLYGFGRTETVLHDQLSLGNAYRHFSVVGRPD